MVKPNMENPIKNPSFISMAWHRFWSEETLFTSLATLFFAFIPSLFQFIKPFSKFSDQIISDLFSIDLIFYVFILSLTEAVGAMVVRKIFFNRNKQCEYKFTIHIQKCGQSLAIAIIVLLLFNSFLFYVSETFFYNNLSVSALKLFKCSIIVIILWFLFCFIEWFIVSRARARKYIIYKKYNKLLIFFFALIVLIFFWGFNYR